MKITCTTENLRTAVTAVERFTGRHITLPILSHFIIQATEKKILLLATNLEVGIEYQLSAKLHKPGTVSVPAKLFTQVLHSLPDEQVTCEAKHHQLILHTPTTDAVLNGLNPNDFPNLPTIKREHSFTITAQLLIRALQQVVPAAATSDVKPELSGVLVRTAPETLTLAATDSFRLAERRVTPAEGVLDTVECIVPARLAGELLRAIPDGDTEVEVTVGEHQIVFAWDGTRILSRLIDGAYPPYQNIIPQSYETTVLVGRGELLPTVRLASVFSSRLNDVTLRFSSTELEVTTTNADTGSTRIRLAVKGRGAAGSVVFNHRFLSDGLEAAGGEQVLLSMNGVSGPTLIQNPSDPSFRYLLMPIRSV